MRTSPPQATRSGDTLTLPATDLADGEHAVAFSATSSNLFRHDVRKDWRFTVDTSIPTLELAGSAEEGRINTDPATFSGKTEPYATVTVVDGEIKASGTADASGAYAVSADLPEGASRVVITTTDRAGNATTKKLRVFVDAVPPVLKTTQLDKIVKHAGVTMRVKATDQLGVPKSSSCSTTRSASWRARPPRPSSPSRASPRAATPSSSRRPTRAATSSPASRSSSSTAPSASAPPPCGPAPAARTSRSCRRSSSTPASTRARRPSVYDSDTEKAVRRLQAKYGLEVDGIVGGNVLNVLSGQIVVDLGDLQLYLYRDGQLVKSYPVAAGQPEYPTPTGSYVVTSMQMNPTWLPPDSDWAKDAKPIPPGIDNPLGTRWIGTSAPGVGIHGTPDDSSIGTYASHGCIRMHIYDVEDLYARVVIGLPVIIRP